LLQGVQVIDQNLVDCGGWGDVWKGQMNEQVIAVKAMRFPASVDSEARKVLIVPFLCACEFQSGPQAFIREAIIWRSFNHPNVLPFYGIYHWNNRFTLVSPWMENGNIVQYLKNNPDAKRAALVR
jgi:serine/threonine protein kinase